MKDERNQKLVIECNRCKHVWLYTGKSEYFATCSYCRNLVRIDENIVVDEEHSQLSQQELKK